jgi:hypothetical protein
VTVSRSPLDGAREAARLAHAWLKLAAERSSPLDAAVGRTFSLCAGRVQLLLDRLDLLDPEHWKDDDP